MKVKGIRSITLSFDEETGETRHISVQLSTVDDAGQETHVSTAFNNPSQLLFSDLFPLDELPEAVRGNASKGLRVARQNAAEHARDLGLLVAEKVKRDFGLEDATTAV